MKLHHARISYLEIKIQELEKRLFYKSIDKNNATIYRMSDYLGFQGDKITYLQDLIANTQITESEVTGYKELLNLLNFYQHQLQQLDTLTCTSCMGFCAVFMTAVAIVSVAVTALGLSALTCGVAVAIASCVELLGSALYRHKPEVFDNTFKTRFCTEISSL